MSCTTAAGENGVDVATRPLSKPALRLLDAALELFYRQGTRATTVREITGACGLTPGALYNHFSSKEELLYRLVRDLHVRLEADVAAAQATVAGNPFGELVAIVRVYVARHARGTRGARVANRDYLALSGEWLDDIVAIRRRLRDRVTAVLLEGQRAGVFSVCGGGDRTSAALTAITILDMCIHVSEWFHEGRPLSAAELEERYIAMALRLVGAAPAPAPADGPADGPAGRKVA